MLRLHGTHYCSDLVSNMNQLKTVNGFNSLSSIYNECIDNDLSHIRFSRNKFKKLLDTIQRLNAKFDTDIYVTARTLIPFGYFS